MSTPITIDFTGVKALTDLAQEFPRAAIRALNRTGRAAEVQANAEIRKTWNLTRRDVDKSIFHRIAGVNRISARGVMEYRIWAKGARVAWIRFNPRQTRAGISIMIRKGGRKQVRSAFIPQMPTGHMGVFVRKGAKRRMTKGRYASSTALRQPIVERRTISVAEMFGAQSVRKRLDEFVGVKLVEEMNAQVSFIRMGK